jgi:hypothetical protein
MSIWLRLLIAGLQGLGAVLLLGAVSDYRAQEGFDFFAVLMLLIGLAGMIGAALLVLDLRWGWRLSTLVQALQVVQFSIASLTYKLSLGASLLAGFRVGSRGFFMFADFDLGRMAFSLTYGGSKSFAIGLNLLALAFFLMLVRGAAQRFTDTPVRRAPHARLRALR